MHIELFVFEFRSISKLTYLLQLSSICTHSSWNRCSTSNEEVLCELDRFISPVQRGRIDFGPAIQAIRNLDGGNFDRNGSELLILSGLARNTLSRLRLEYRGRGERGESD